MHGSFGLVINQPQPFVIRRVGALCRAWRCRGAAAPRTAVVGEGPVSPTTGWVLRGHARARGPPGDHDHRARGLAVDLAPERLRALASQPPERIRLLLGYSGWARIRLASGSMARGSSGAHRRRSGAHLRSRSRGHLDRGGAVARHRQPGGGGAGRGIHDRAGAPGSSPVAGLERDVDLAAAVRVVVGDGRLRSLAGVMAEQHQVAGVSGDVKRPLASLVVATPSPEPSTRMWASGAAARRARTPRR
ncbi:MAG: YqgE/AlgH family protein [Kofleriaceae bacterium]|nr:YqgE/AlgH family protein [Kofleriaceae bacterium]